MVQVSNLSGLEGNYEFVALVSTSDFTLIHTNVKRKKYNLVIEQL
jgi:hypothetical protein